MRAALLLGLCLSACATGAPFRALVAEAALPGRTVSFHPLGSDQPLARSAGQWARYRERVGINTQFITVTLKAEPTGWAVQLRRDGPKGYEEQSMGLALSGFTGEDPFLRALQWAQKHDLAAPEKVTTKAGTFEQARSRGGLRFHPRVPVFGLVYGRRGLYQVELMDFGLHPAPKN